MLQNPQLAQSYILLTLLRKQRDRILNKVLSLPNLHQDVCRLHNQLVMKRKAIDNNKYVRQQMKTMLQIKLQQSSTTKSQTHTSTTTHLKSLRSNLHNLKNTKSQLSQQSTTNQQLITQQQQLQTKLSSIQQQIKSQCKSLQQSKIYLYSLLGERDTGQRRVNDVLRLYADAKDEERRCLGVGRCLGGAVESLGGGLEAVKGSLGSVQASFMYTRSLCVHQKQSIEQKKLNIDKLACTLTQLQHILTPLQTQVTQQQQTSTKLQHRLEQKLAQCEKISGQTEVVKAEINVLEREAKLVDHRIQCVRVLVKRLYMCGSRLNSSRRGKLQGSFNGLGASQISKIDKSGLRNMGSRYNSDIGIMSRVGSTATNMLEQKTNLFNIGDSSRAIIDKWSKYPTKTTAKGKLCTN